MKKKITLFIILGIIVLLGGFFRFYKLGDSSFDRDEFFGLNTSYGYYKTGEWVAWDFNNQEIFNIENPKDFNLCKIVRMDDTSTPTKIH